MFRLESYIAPLVMNYIDRYVKLKQEDFRMSLWGGAATLNQLDLRLDAIEAALNLPIKLSNGHIRELKIQVPWTKLGFEPVLITIDTIECMLSLRDGDDRSDSNDTRSESSYNSSSNMKRSKSKKKLQAAADVPPGYIQSLLNRIMNNVNIVVENLILKFVEEDIVLSINVKTMEIFSVNSDWKRAYAELSAPDFVLRRLIEFSDMTVCLDKMDPTTRKISTYQDPLIYRCSLQTRIYTKYSSLHTSMPTTTKIHTMCETLMLSLSDTQLPMFLRLIELLVAIYYGDLPTSSSTKKEPTPCTPHVHTDTALQVDPQETDDAEGSVDQEPSGGESVGWASWAWSMVPPVLPSSKDSDDETSSSGEEGSEDGHVTSPPVFDISFYNKRASLVFKLSKTVTSSLKNHSSKVAFDPIAELKIEGNSIEILAKGLTFLDFQFGITKANISGIGDCICGMVEPKYQQDVSLLKAGKEDIQQNHGLHYLTGCLFDTSQHHGSISSYIFDYNTHCQKYKESWAIERFGALWINYLWIEENNGHTATQHTDIKPAFIDEVSYMKFWFHQLTLNYTSNMRHRLDKILYCASNHSYEPYAKKVEEVVDPNRSVPCKQQVEWVERFIPVKNIHLAFLRSSIDVYPANHCYVDVKSNSKPKGKGNRQCTQPACCLKLSTERLDLQSTSPMYPRKLVKMISRLPQPSSNLVHHCRYHQNIKVMRLEVGLVKQHSCESEFEMSSVKGQRSLMLPLSAAYYYSSLLLPMYWTEHNLERRSVLYELPEASLVFTLPQLETAVSVCMSWSSDSEIVKLDTTSLVHDAFDTSSGKFPIVDVSFNRLEVKQTSTKSIDAAFGNLGSIIISIIAKDEHSDEEMSATLLQAPADTSLLGNKHLFTTSKPIHLLSDDFLCFTYQLPKADGNSWGSRVNDDSALLLCNMQGWSCTADPAIIKCLLYKEEKTSAPLPTVTSLQELESSQQSAHTTGHGSTAVMSERKRQHVSPESKHNKSNVNQSASTTCLDYLKTLYALSPDLSVNINIKSGCIMMPLHSLLVSVSNHQYNMPEQWRQLSYTQALPPCFVICLPSITAKSTNVGLSAPVEDIPISSANSRRAGAPPGFPITAVVEHLSAYSITERDCHYLLKPVNCMSTMTLTTQHNDGSIEGNLQSLPSSVSLHISTEVDPIQCNVSALQTVLTLDLLTLWMEVVPLVYRHMASTRRDGKGGGSGTTQDAMASTDHCHSSVTMQGEEEDVLYPNLDADSESAYDLTAHNASSETKTSSSPNLSVKAEVKVPQFALNIFLNKEGYKRYCLRAVSEEIRLNIDMYRDYVKVQLKVWFAELLHGYYDIRCEEYVPGPRHGILLSSSQRFVNLQSRLIESDTDILTAQDISQMMKEKPRDGFLSLTYTIASSQSLKQQLSHLDIGDGHTDIPHVIKSAAEHSSSRDYLEEGEMSHISELCLDLTRCDIICHVPVIASSVQVLMLDLAPTVKSLLSNMMSSGSTTPSTPSKERINKKSPAMPWFDSQTLPLFHFTAGNTRLLLPMEGSGEAGGHDVIILGVDGVELSPQADNPLSRLVLDSHVYKHKINNINSSGSLVDNREFQIDVHGMSMFAGNWSEMELEDKKLGHSSSENPAFEWNKIAKAEELKVAKMYPILAPLDLKLQLAPAIVYHNTVVCGHTVEINVTSDVSLSLTDVHIDLMYSMYTEVLSMCSNILNRKQTAETNHTPSSPTLTPRIHIEKQVQSLADYVALVTPIDMLMTARRISLSLIGSSGKQAIINVSFTHPHTLLCTKPSCERLEISSYDMSIMLGRPSALRSPGVMLPNTKDFSEPLLVSKPGLPDDKTGIFPCLFTLKVKNFLEKPDISVENGKPVSISISLASLEKLQENIVQLIPEPLRVKQIPSSAPQHPTTRTTSQPDILLLNGYPMFPVNTLTATAAQLSIKVECDEKSVDFVMQQYGVALLFVTSADLQQLDCTATLNVLDAELLVASKQLPSSRLLGPLSFNININSALSRLHVPFSSCVLSSAVVPLHVGNENVRVLGLCLKDLSALSRQKQPAVQSTNSHNSGSLPTDTEQKDSVERPHSLTIAEYHDDLRMGTFKYLLDKEKKLPIANTVLFYSEQDFSTLTWSYGEPRIISAIHINPIPFDYPVDPNASFLSQDVQIGCSLEYWNSRLNEFTEYSEFSISEQFGTSLSLPLASSDAAVSSRTWRIIIHYYIGRNYFTEPAHDYVFAMVSPAVLVAAMRVDSKYVPSLVPTLQMSLDIGQIRVRVITNHGVGGSAAYHDKLHPFRLNTDKDIPEHDIFNILLSNNKLEVSVWQTHSAGAELKPTVKFLLSNNLVLRFIEYGHLVWKPMLELDDVKVNGHISRQKNQTRLGLDISVGDSRVLVSQECVNTLLQLMTLTSRNESPSTPLPINSLYTICNNTHIGLYVKQTGCDDVSMIHILPGSAHSFCWAKYSPKKVNISLDRDLTNWSSSIPLIDVGLQIGRIKVKGAVKERIETPDFIPMFVDIENITCIHKMITVSGSLCVSSRLNTSELDVRISTSTEQHHHVKLSPHHSFSSFAVSSSCISVLRIRNVKGEGQQQHPYSRPLDVTSASSLAPHTISMNGEDTSEADVCYRVIFKEIDSIAQCCVEFSPLYSIRSYLPHILALGVSPGTSSWLVETAATTELTGLTGSKSYQLSLRPSETNEESAVTLPLTLETFSSIHSIEDHPDSVSILDLCRQTAASPHTSTHLWPTSSQNSTLEGKFLPISLAESRPVATDTLVLNDIHTDNVGVEVEWSQRWTGTASLLMTIKPRCVFMNNSSTDLCLVYGSQFSMIQPQQTVLSPSSLQAHFSLGVYSKEQIFTSNSIHLSEEEVNPRSFFLPNESNLFMESYTYCSIAVGSAQHTQQILYLVVTSHTCDGVRVITLHDRFILHNSTKDGVSVSAYLSPISSNRVHPQQIASNPTQIKAGSSTPLHLTTSHQAESRSAAALYLTFSLAEADWSYPLQLPIEYNARRQLTTALPLPSTHDTRALCLVLSITNGVTYLVMTDSHIPSIFIHNRCSLPLAFGQTLTNKSEDVLESMSLLSEPPVVKSMHSTSYTFTTVNKRFPSHVMCADYPKLKIAGVGSQYGVEVWSEGINVFDDNPLCLLHIPDIGEVKVTIQTSQLDQHLYIEFIDRARVAVQEVITKDGQTIAIPHHTDSSSPDDSQHMDMETHTTSTLQQYPALASTKPSAAPSNEITISASLVADEVSLVLMDSQLAKEEESSEFLRMNLQGVGVWVEQSLREDIKDVRCMAVELYVLDLHLHNQQAFSGHYDFPLVLSAQKSLSLDTSSDKLAQIQEKHLMKAELSFESSLSREGFKLVTVCLDSRPLCLQIEDVFLQSAIKTVDSYVTLANLLPTNSSRTQKGESMVPHKVLSDTARYCTVLALRKLHIDKCELLVSIHASLKVFVATDNAPITLSPFSRQHMVTTFAQLLADLGFHYGTGALYCAGWLVGSLELLFNPTGIVRSVVAGLSDMIYLPYYGLQQSPAAFVTGVSQGMTSVVKNVTQSTLSSVTQFAQSVSRNMDRLSLDTRHSERQKLMRQNTPQALSQGLRQGFDGLALSFLGAVAGLADEPLQGLWAEELSVPHRAAAVVTGVGKGLLGAFTKPISGTAEFISQTGHGLMGSIGLAATRSALPLHTSSSTSQHSLYDFTILKYHWSLPILSQHNGEVLCVLRVISPSDTLSLLLFGKLVLVMDSKENEQQQSFALSEIDCSMHERRQSTYLRIYLAGRRKSSVNSTDDSTYQLRVKDYVYSTSSSGYQSLPESPYYNPAAAVTCTSSASLLHEYCVSAQDVGYFLTMFRYAQRICSFT